MHFIIIRGPDWVFYMSANEPQTLRWIFLSYQHLFAEFKKQATILDDVIKTYENLHVEEQNQLKNITPKIWASSILLMEH
jgi:hypothetical protein